MTEHSCTTHQPGTPSCSRNHGCHCEPCHTAELRRAKRSRAGLHALVPQAAAHAHITRLLTQGMALAEIARRAGVSDATITRIATWQVLDITRHTHAAIMAVQPAPIDRHQLGLTDATGTRRRMQGLVALGWPQAILAARLGTSAPQVARLLDDTTARVTVEVRNRVVDLYNQLSMTLPADNPGGSTTKARRFAARHGWAVPLCWDEREIDDPAAQPHRPPDTRRGRRIEDITDLIAAGETNPLAIAGRVGMTPKQVRAALDYARPDLLPKLVDPLAQDRIRRGVAA